MRRPSLILCSFVLGALGAAAHAAAQPRVLQAEEIRALLTDKTLHYSRDGENWGVEHHFSDRSRAHWRTGEEECLRGFWNTQGDMLCYFYSLSPQRDGGCWRMVEDAGVYYHVPLDADPLTLEDAVRIDVIDEAPVTCEPGRLACEDQPRAIASGSG